MTVDLTLLTVAVVIVTAVAIYGVSVQIPQAMVSADRYRLWELRDRVVLDLVDGRLSKSAASAQLLHDIENRLHSARRFTLARLTMLYFRCGGLDLPDNLLDKAVPHHDADRIRAYKAEFHVITARALRTNTWFGLVVSAGFAIGDRVVGRRLQRIKAGIRSVEKGAVREPELIGVHSTGPLALQY